MEATIPWNFMQGTRVTNKRSNYPAYYVRKEESTDEWNKVSWREYGKKVKEVVRAIVGVGAESGSRIAIISNPRPWLHCDSPQLQYIMQSDNCSSSVQGNNDDQLLYFLNHSEAAIIFVGDEEQLKKISNIKNSCPHIKWIIIMSSTSGNLDDPTVLDWKMFLEMATLTEEDLVETLAASVKPEQTSLIVYTAGAQGFSKGVLLSHSNISWTANKLATQMDYAAVDTEIVFMPMNQILDIILSVCVPVLCGSAVYFSSPEKVADDMFKVQPTKLCCPAFIWESLYNRISTQLPNGVESLRSAAVSQLQKGMGFLKLTSGAYCQGAIGKPILEFMEHMDVPIYQIYGMTEACGIIALNRKENAKLGTVGHVLDEENCDLKISSQGEILFRGKNVFQGYYKDEYNPIVGGWLHTGDLGKINRAGYLKVVGRMEDRFCLATGGTVDPDKLESRLRVFPLIGQACVVGDGRPFLSALIALRPEVITKAATEKKVQFEDIVEAPPTREAIQKFIDKLHALHPTEPKLEKFVLLPNLFSFANGEATSIENLCRKKILANYSKEIDSMYNSPAG